MSDSAEGRATSWWDALRRRKVVQWGLLYVAGAWGFLQGLEYVGESFNWPQQVRQVALLALAVGLPIVLVLAWYHGDRGEQRLKSTEVAIIALLFLLGGGIFWRYERAAETAPVPATSPAAAATATDASIAVLPFVNMSADKEQEYFADGISEELLNLLAKVPELRVIARTSSFSFKGKDVEIAEIARRLNVANVLEGSVRKSGDTLRITAQLVRASDSSHLWSQTYDRQMTDVFKVQDEIAAEVVAQLRIKLLGAAPKLLTTDPRAYALFLRAREATRNNNSEGFGQAVALYKQVLAIDRTYAPAWDGLADAYYNQIDLGVLITDQGFPLASDAASQALAADPGYASAYARVAMMKANIDRDLVAAKGYVEQGLARDPANLDVLGAAAWIVRRLGRFDQAIELAEYLTARDPINPQSHQRLGNNYLFAGRLDETLNEFRTVLKLSPASAAQHEEIGEVLLLKGDAQAALEEIQQEPEEHWRLVGLAMAFHALGRNAESDAALDELIKKYEQTMSFNITYVLAFRGETDRAFEWLERTAKYRDLAFGAIPFDPILRRLHSDPRWLPFLRKHGMAPEQLAAIKFDVTVPN